MTIRLIVYDTVDYQTYPGIGAGVSYRDLFDSTALYSTGKSKNALTVAITLHGYASTSGSPTITVAARKADASSVNLSPRVVNDAYYYNGEGHFYEFRHIGIHDIADLPSLNRIRVTSTKNFWEMGAAYYWMYDVDIDGVATQYQEVYSTSYTFTDHAVGKQRCLQLSAAWPGLESGTTIPSPDCRKTFAGHYRRSLNNGDIQGGIKYSGLRTFRAVNALYKPFYYGQPMLTQGR